MAKTANSAATRALQQELKSIQKEPLEGFTVSLVNDNLFEWEVAIFGPPNTLYQGGYFKSHIKFPSDYPYSPPSVRFATKMWHPNIYENGDVCISILHPPVDDPTNTELPSEKWNPAQNVRTVMMSIISLLNEPNTFSPANVDASVMYRRYIESKGADKEYENIIRKQVLATRPDAEKDGVYVPQTLEEYCVKASGSKEYDNANDDCIMDDLDDLDPYENNDDSDCNYDESNTDSGNEES
ncbi:ubiquitin-conjugating enzyme E2 R2 [Brachionus plicatilis]|uniref:Ubiquitin-conjugating enzyme E2 R2 n=2 Tax=Brachionus plicatilis TaxID=10195 RepID=A0A3M7QLW5_BRAPC|nr:ubiquitin-conjugating enzyme E2 R2 [Brachionus plicatilis]